MTPRISARWPVAALLALVPALLWQFYPPFEDAASYEALSYQEVVSRLGPPDEWMPEKHVAWRRQRVFSFWYLTASNRQPPGAEPPELHAYVRMLCMGTVNYNIKVAM